MEKQNKLKNSICYECGPIDFAKDDGYGWRNQITPVLQSMGIKVLNPLDKPIIGHLEDPLTREQRRERQLAGDFEYIFNQRDVRAIDLRMVDHCDFLLVYFDPNDRPFGTIEELTWANRLKRPIIVVTPGGPYTCSPWLIWAIGWKTIFSNFEDAITYIKGIDDGTIEGGKRWIFFNRD